MVVVYIYNSLITLSDLRLMGVLSRLFVALVRMQSGAAGGQRRGKTTFHLLEFVHIGCHGAVFV
jgi:hypothetical protein